MSIYKVRRAKLWSRFGIKRNRGVGAAVELPDYGLYAAGGWSPRKQLLFDLLLDRPKPLFGAGCSISPVLNLPCHLLYSVFGGSELHGKLVCKTHGPIAVFFCQVSRRSNLRDDSLSCVVQLSNSIRRLLFGREFKHLLRCVCLTLIYD